MPSPIGGASVVAPVSASPAAVPSAAEPVAGVGPLRTAVRTVVMSQGTEWRRRIRVPSPATSLGTRARGRMPGVRGRAPGVPGVPQDGSGFDPFRR